MAVKTWDQATKAAADLKEYAEFIVDDIGAKHIRAAIRWADDAIDSAREIKAFLKSTQSPSDVGQISENTPVLSIVFLGAIGILAVYALIKK